MGVKAKALDLKVELHNDYAHKVAKDDSALDELAQLAKVRDQLKQAYERIKLEKIDSEA